MTTPPLSQIQQYVKRPLSQGEIRARAVAAAVKEGICLGPISGHWDTGDWTPSVYVEELKKGRTVIPTIRMRASPFEIIPDANTLELLALAKDRQLPLLLRFGNIEEVIVNAGIETDDYSLSGLYWPEDFSDGLNYRGTIDAAGGDVSPIALPSGANRGDYWKIINISKLKTATFGQTNTVSGTVNDRLVCRVDGASDTDASDWVVAENRLSPSGALEAWTAAGDAYGNAQLDAIINAYPNPPLVMMLSNNEAPKVFWSNHTIDHRFVTENSPIDNNDANAKMRDLWPVRYNALFAAIRNQCASRSSGWNGNIRFFGYQLDGTDVFTGVRGERPNYTMDAFVNGSYGSEAECWDGNSEEWYHQASDGTYDVKPRAVHFSQSVTAVRASDWARTIRPDWIDGLTVYPSGSMIYGCQVAGHGELDPRRFGGFVRFCTFLMRPSFVHHFQNNDGGIDDPKIPDGFLVDQGTDWPTYAATYGLTRRYTDRDYWDAQLDALEVFWGEIAEGMGWELDSQPASLEIPINFLRQSEIVGPYATQASVFLMAVDENPDFQTWTVNTEPIWALCRRDGAGKGVIYVWNPKADAPCTVNTADGAFQVTATPAGAFYLYDGNSLNLVEQQNLEAELEIIEAE